MKTTYISHGHYRISDTDAGILAKAVGKKLPKHGYALTVELPSDLSKEFGVKLADLLRAPFTGWVSSPKRGWVWAVMPRSRP